MGKRVCFSAVQLQDLDAASYRGLSLELSYAYKYSWCYYLLGSEAVERDASTSPGEPPHTYKPLNPLLNILDSRYAPSPNLVRKTNAARLIAGLPLNPPHRVRTGQFLSTSLFFRANVTL